MAIYVYDKILVRFAVASKSFHFFFRSFRRIAKSHY